MLGFGSAFVLSVATYRIFKFLDRKASGPAKRAVSKWINGDDYERVDVRSAIVNAFDHIYGFPLFRLRSFLKSATYTTIAFVLFLIWIAWSHLYAWTVFTWTNPSMRVSFITTLLGNILSDYLALFVVRKSLDASKDAPSSTIIRGTLIGATVIIAVQAAFTYLGDVIVAKNFFEAEKMFTQFWAIVAQRLPVLRIIFLAIPALLVLVWLPLLGIGVLGTRALRALLRTVRWAQWFIKQGNQHPLEAIGLVAAATVFVITAVAGVFR